MECAEPLGFLQGAHSGTWHTPHDEALFEHYTTTQIVSIQVHPPRLCIKQNPFMLP